MTTVEHFAPTTEIRRAVSGRELEILSELGIGCTDGSRHIKCPCPTHVDNHPSWRWDQAKARAFCTCTRSDSIFDVIMKLREIGFKEAKVLAAQTIGRMQSANGQANAGGPQLRSLQVAVRYELPAADDVAVAPMRRRPS
jgi:hypothetical protein